MGPHWPQDGLYGVPTVTWRHNHNFHFFFKIDDRGLIDNLHFGAWYFFTVLTHFFYPMGPHWPQDGPYGVPTVVWRHNRNFQFFWKNRWPRGYRKFKFSGMVIFKVLTHFFYPMGPHWPQYGLYGVPTVIWHHNRNFHFFGKIDDENSNFGAW